MSGRGHEFVRLWPVAAHATALGEEIEQSPDSGRQGATLTDVDRMKRFPVARIAAFENGYETAGGDVGVDRKGCEPCQAAAPERELPQRLAIARLYSADGRDDDDFAVLHQRPAVDRSDIAEAQPVVTFEVG